MELVSLMSKNISLLTMLNAGTEDVSYCVRLASVTNRKNITMSSNKFSNLMSGFSSAVNDTISSAIRNSFLVKLKNGNIFVISEKTQPLMVNLPEIRLSLVLENNNISVTILFASGVFENISLKLTSENLDSSFYGSLQELLGDFDYSGQIPITGISDKYMTVRFSRHTANPSKLYEFKPVNTYKSLISFDESGVYLYNLKQKIPFSNILAVNNSGSGYRFLFVDSSGIMFAEITEGAKLAEPEFNLIVKDESERVGGIELAFPEGIPHAESLLAVFIVGRLTIAALDDGIYAEKNGRLLKCGIFKIDEDIYVKTSDNTTEKYERCRSITEPLSMLPFECDRIFADKACPQPFVINGELSSFEIKENGISSGPVCFEFAKMEKFAYKAENFTCTMSFIYDNQPVKIITANSLGVMLSNMQEKISQEDAMKSYSINGLYDCYYKQQAKSFLAGTLLEIFRTNKMLNENSSVGEMIKVLRAEDSVVIRNMFRSVVGKFKNIDDLQSDLIQKVTLLEIQRRKIQKIFDEWLLYYPHYMADSQVKWLKHIFSPYIKPEILKKEYWKCVAVYKRTLSSCNAYIQKSMNEIGNCANKISAALPDDVRRADITSSLKITSVSTEEALKTGGDTLVGVTAAAELGYLFTRGFSGTSPIALSMSAKMLIDSYAKDVTLRKNIKTYGLQALEWWEILMKGLQIHILELSHEASEYNKYCLARDTELFKTLPPEAAGKVKQKLTDALKQKINDGIDEKYLSVLPQMNTRISNIIDDIDAAAEFRDETLDEFKNRLFI